MQERQQAFLGLRQVADFAFPQHEDLLAEVYEGDAVPLVKGSVHFDLWRPIRGIRLWPLQSFAASSYQLKSCLYLIGLHQNVGVFEADGCLTANT